MGAVSPVPGPAAWPLFRASPCGAVGVRDMKSPFSAPSGAFVGKSSLSGRRLARFAATFDPLFEGMPRPAHEGAEADRRGHLAVVRETVDVADGAIEHG